MKGWLPKIVYEITAAGELSEKCLEAGALSTHVHYYSHVMDIKGLHAQDFWSRKVIFQGSISD